jgi:Tol biopolymer transport system component
MADRRQSAVSLWIVGFASFLGWAGAAAAVAGPPQISLLSRGSASFVSDAAGGSSTGGGLSADGRYAVFSSTAANLGPWQRAAASNIFLYDRVTGARILASHSAVTPTTTANGYSYGPLLSADGRWVVYSSLATDLVVGQSDIPATLDVFLYDRQTDTTRLLSRVSGTVATATGLAYSPAIDDDGSAVVFTSAAPNLVAGQSGNTTSVYLYDRGTDSLTLVSHSAGAPTTTANGSSVLPQLSGDGRYVVYSSVGTDLVPGQSGGATPLNVYLYDRASGTNRLVSHASTSATTGGNADSFGAVLSDDGGTLAFASSATNLLAGIAEGNTNADVFLYDRATAALTLVSRTAASPTTTGNAYSSHPALSADGRYLAFESGATDLLAGVSDTNSGTDIFLFDRTAATLTLVSRTSGAANVAGNGSSDALTISADGRFVAFETLATDLTSPARADQNQAYDAYLFDRTTGTATLVSHAFDTPNGPAVGNSQFPIVSADGAWVLFISSAFDLDATARDLNRSNDVFLYKRANEVNSLLSRRDPARPSVTAAGASSTPAVSADGRWVAFISDAPNLLAGVFGDPAHPGLYLADTLFGTLTLANPSAANPSETSNGLLTDFVLARDGQSLAYSTTATDAVPGQIDTNGQVDIFLYDRPTATSILVSHRAGAPLTAGSSPLSQSSFDLSTHGRFLAYTSTATDLVPGQVEGNNSADVFLFDRATGANTLVSHAAGVPAKTGDNQSFTPRVSDDGRFVAYTSDSSDLVAGANAGGGDNVYLYDSSIGTNALVTHPAGLLNMRASGYLSDMTPDGRFLLVTSQAVNFAPGQLDANGTYDVFLWDRATDSALLLSHTAASATTAGNSISWGVGLSADGRFALWQSEATDILAGQPSNALYLLLTDLATGTTTLVAHDYGFSTPRLTADGAFVFFTVPGPLLDPPPPGPTHFGPSQLFFYDRQAGTTTLVSHTAGSADVLSASGIDQYAVSADGAAIAFSSRSTDFVANDYNVQQDVFLATNPRPGSAFFTLPPCRLFDSRLAGPALPAGIPRTLATRGVCGIPATAQAIAANVTVIQPTAAGHLSLYPGDTAVPLASSLNFSGGQTRANNTVLKLSFDGRGDFNLAPFMAGTGSVHVVVDVTGYFQ